MKLFSVGIKAVFPSGLGRSYLVETMTSQSLAMPFLILYDPDSVFTAICLETEHSLDFNDNSWIFPPFKSFKNVNLTKYNFPDYWGK